MAFQLTDLDRAALLAKSRRHSTLIEARNANRKTAFLSHSHLDRDRAKGLQKLLDDAGWDVFIDWEHNSLDGQRPTKETARWLQTNIEACDWLMYLATPNSEKSRWCPWEIGYADGKKDARAIVVIATTVGQTTYGSEYLDLYRQIGPADGSGELTLYEASNKTGRGLRGVSTTPSMT